jgi:uncharacterized protein YacL
MLQLQAPTENKILSDQPSPREVPMYVRIILAVVFGVLGFTFSRSVFFQDYPLFGRPFLAEILISLLSALIGFYLIPKGFSGAKKWLQKFIIDVISDIVFSFWEQQSERMRDARKEREEKKQTDLEDRLKEELCGLFVLDTSVLVDGRILDIAKTGILPCELVVPEFVVDELQRLADSKDKVKREKGRRGLDFLKALKKATGVKITNSFEADEGGVDKALVNYAKKYDMSMITLDYNLNKVASVSGVSVVNINDLANALRMVLVPGERVDIKIVDEGQEKGQGVGYLEDGTMVVVEKGRDLVGRTVRVKIKKSIQASAGRMFFAEVV